MPQVTMPDGTLVDMPDQLPPELGTRLRSFNDSHNAPAKPDWADKVADATNGYIDPKASGHMLKGFGDTLLTGALNIPHAVVGAVSDLGHRLTGNADAPAPAWADHLQAHLGESGKDFVHGVGDVAEGTGAADLARAGVRNFNSHDDFRSDLVRNGLGVMGDVAAITPVGGLAKTVASNIGRSVADAAIPDAAARAAGEAAGFRNASGAAGKVGNYLAGDSATPALIKHNADVGAVHARAESNIPHDQPLNHETFAAGREGPSSVYQRAANATPDGPFDETAQQQIASAGLPEGGRITAGSPQAQAQIETLRARLLDPTNTATGQQKLNELRALRQEGYANVGSEDVSNQQLGKAQLDMARAIEGHMERSIPADADVSPEQFRDARKALAKSHTWQSALRGNDVDLNVLARVQRADPYLLDGNTKVAADFANANKEAVGIPTKLGAPSIPKDLASLNPLHPIKSTIQAVGGGLGRQLLRGGNTLTTVEQLRNQFPVSAERFAPLPPPTLPEGTVKFQPSPEVRGAPIVNGRQVATDENGPIPTHTTGNDIPFADMLTHGVERPPAPGLSLGEPPQALGMKFSAPPDSIGMRVPTVRRMAGDTIPPSHAIDVNGEPVPTGMTGPVLGDRFTAGNTPPPHGDLPSVMSQGVPEGIMQRAPRQAYKGDTVDFPSGASHYRINNDSGSGPASLEAQSRLSQEKGAGMQPTIVDPDGNPTRVLHDVTAVDRQPPKGHIIIDAKTGKLLNRGGMSESLARGLLNRWRAMHGSLADGLSG